MPEVTGRSQTTRRNRLPCAELTKEQELTAYREMLLIRRFEEKAGQMYGMGLIGGFCHLYIGQEAVVVGMQMTLKQGDSGHHRLPRPRPHAGLRHGPQGRHGGADRPPRRLFAAARAARCTCSRVEKGFFGGHGIVGAQVSLGTGLAFANRYRKNDNVSLTYFGDGAANQGQVYESFNMAELWKLPVVYIIENNRYAMGTAITRSSATDRLVQARRLVRHSGRAGRRHGRARREGRRREGRRRGAARATGPYILEMLTYRYRGHSMSDPAKYRTREEVAEDAHRARSDRAGARAPAGEQVRRPRTISRRSTPRCATSSTRPPSSPPTIPSRMSPSSGRTCTADAECR